METACAKQHLLQLHLANIQLLAGLPRKVLRDTAVQLDMYAEQKMIWCYLILLIQQPSYDF